jgi:signal transduction histidine kinase
VQNDQETLETILNELKQKLVSKSIELEEAQKELKSLTGMLEISTSDLLASEEELAVSDANSALKSIDLKKAEDALALSDAKLIEASKQLANTVRELANATAELKKRDTLQKEFINIAAHELRTPVQPIIATMELLGFYTAKKAEEEEEEEEEVKVKRSELKMIARNAIRLERLSA